LEGDALRLTAPRIQGMGIAVLAEEYAEKTLRERYETAKAVRKLRDLFTFRPVGCDVHRGNSLRTI